MLNRHLFVFFLTLISMVLGGISAHAQTVSYEDQVQKMYVAYYGRPGDPDGISFWAEQLDSHSGDLDAIVDAFGNSSEYQERFAGLDNSALVNNIYQQLFGRDADTEGLDFYTGWLNSGIASLGSIALNIADGIAGENDDALTYNNKLAVANAFTAEIEISGANYSAANIDTAKALLDTVDATSLSLSNALAALITMIDSFDSDQIGDATLSMLTHENTLMAIASLSLSESGRAYIEFYSDNTPVRQSELSATASDHQITVVGMRANTPYQFRAHVELDSGGHIESDLVSFTSGPLPAEAPTVSLNSQSEDSLGGITFFGALGTYWGVDEEGEIVWYLHGINETANTAVIRQLDEGDFAGHLLVFLRDELRIISAAGETLRSYDLSAADGYHHDARILPNGHVIALGQETGAPHGEELLADRIIELDTEGNVVWQWSTLDHLDTTRFPTSGSTTVKTAGLDWSHCNAVVYLAEEDEILLSCRHQNWVIKIDHQSGDIIWILGDDEEIDADFEADFFALESGSWFTAQHAPIPTGPVGDSEMLIYDNRNYSNGRNVNSRAVSYTLDEANLTVRQNWEYVVPKFTNALGDVDALSDAHVLVSAGGPDGDDEDAHIIEITSGASPTAVWEITVHDLQIYRAERVSWQDFLDPSPAATECDIKLTNGQIYTFDENDSIVSALTMTGNTIQSLGAAAEATTGCATEIDLQGRVVIPGLNDAHVHYFDRINAGGHVVAEIDTARTQQDVINVLNAAIDIQNVAEVSGSVTVRNFLVTEGGNFAAQLVENSWPSISALNGVPRPVFLVEGADNEGWVNQSAKDFFDAAGVGNVQTDGKVLDVSAAKNYLLGLESDNDRKEDWMDGNRWAASVGMTAMQNFLGEPLNDNPEIVELYADNTAFLRFHFSVSNTTDYLTTPPSPNPDMLRLTSIGEFHSGSAFSAPGNNYGDDALDMAAAGVTTHQHAMNSNSDIEDYLGLWETAVNIDSTIEDLRWRLDHVFDISQNQMDRLGAMGGNLSVHGIGGGGSARDQNLKQTYDGGINVSGGSDGGNFYAINPWVTMHFFVTGMGQQGNSVIANPNNWLTVYEAVHLYTIGSAYDTFDEKNSGSLEVGKWADLAVLGLDPFNLVNVDDLINVTSVLTIVDGDIVYSNGLLSCHGSSAMWYRKVTGEICALD